jgi:hypothetical protein
MNLIVTRRPNRLVWSDSCPYGIGGFRLHNGRAWRIRIPKASILYGSDRVNNLLEFLGMAINIWLECLDRKEESYSCILALGDNTSAVGWLHNSSRLVSNGTYLLHIESHSSQSLTVCPIQNSGL